MRTRAALYMLLIFVVVALFSCGGDDVCPPPDSIITLSPASIEISDSNLATTTHTEYFTIYVEDSEERPIEGAKLSIYFVWAVPDVYGDVQLYDGATPVNAPFNVQTDEFGVYYLRVDFDSGGGLAYSGAIEVRSCSVYNGADFAVSGGT